MKLYQMADDREVYGEQAGWWLVVSDDTMDELGGPFPTREEAEQAMATLAVSSKDAQ